MIVAPHNWSMSTVKFSWNQCGCGRIYSSSSNAHYLWPQNSHYLGPVSPTTFPATTRDVKQMTSIHAHLQNYHIRALLFKLKIGS